MANSKYIAKRFPSPLRYPGGKSLLTSFLSEVIELNSIKGGTYCEGFAGGAGAALGLLMDNKVDRVVLNDADVHIYSFWNSILKNSSEFIELVKGCSINMAEWHKQKDVYEKPGQYSELEIGFSTFFLNRCNRGGILPKAGPTGGVNQKGNFKIDARFHKENLIPRLEKIAELSNRIDFFSLDAKIFMNRIVAKQDKSSTLVYLDPPYYKQGQNLYLNFYKDKDHLELVSVLNEFQDFAWIVSYDNVDPINRLYSRYRSCAFDINYSVQKARKGKEKMFFSDNIILPSDLVIGKNKYSLTAI